MLFAAALLMASALSGSRGNAQAPSSASSPFVGAWRLVSYTTPDSAGRQRPEWGTRPLGLIVYLSDGTMAAQGFDERRPLLQGTTDASARASAFVGLFAYFGRFDVDAAKRQVTHHVEGAWTPDWIGRDVVRSFRFPDADHLELRVVSNADGRPVTNGGVLLWERVRR